MITEKQKLYLCYFNKTDRKEGQKLKPKIVNFKVNMDNIAVGTPYGVSGQTVSEVKANAIEAAASKYRKNNKQFIKMR